MYLKKFLFVNQAAAYYYHGVILDEGNTQKSHGMAIAALQAAEEFLTESHKASEAFNAAPPKSRFVYLCQVLIQCLMDFHFCCPAPARGTREKGYLKGKHNQDLH